MSSKKFTLLFVFLVCFVAFISCQSTDKQEAAQQNAEQTFSSSPEGQLEKIKQELKDVKTQLTAAGKYDCCTHPTCNWCALLEGECDCHDEIKAGEEVCPGCGLGWHNGQGVVEGIEASQVKWNITHEHEESGDEH
ncbi:MAG: hypothetical protein ACE5IW_06940 [bacterium]